MIIIDTLEIIFIFGLMALLLLKPDWKKSDSYFIIALLLFVGIRIIEQLEGNLFTNLRYQWTAALIPTPPLIDSLRKKKG